MHVCAMMQQPGVFCEPRCSRDNASDGGHPMERASLLAPRHMPAPLYALSPWCWRYKHCAADPYLTRLSKVPVPSRFTKFWADFQDLDEDPEVPLFHCLRPSSAKVRQQCSASRPVMAPLCVVFYLFMQHRIVASIKCLRVCIHAVNSLPG